MKKRLLITSSLAVLLGLGVASGLSLANKEARSVKAASVTLYLDMGAFSDWYSSSATFKVHTWNSGQGDKYHTVTKVGDAFYTASVDLATYASGGGYRFTRYSSDGKTEWNRGEWQSYDASNLKKYYRATDWTAGTWSKENEKTWNLLGSSTGTWTAQTEDINYTLSFRFNDEGLQFINTSVTLTAGSVFKIKNSDGSYYGYDCLTTNSSSYFSGSGSSNVTVVTGGKFEVYMKPFEAKFWIQLSSETEADAYAQEFLSTITCTNTSTTFNINAWNEVAPATTSMEYKFNHLTTGAQHLLTNATASQSGSNIEQCVARYDRILGKYGYGTASGQYHDFMSRTPASLAAPRISILGGTSINDNNNTILLVVIASALAAAGVGGYFFFRRKKQQ